MKPKVFQIAAIMLITSVISSQAATFYVDLNSPNPTPPYSDWSTAATNIQDAINAASNGDQIWVTNGVYKTGGLTMDGISTNRIALNKALTVQSVNGPLVTIIEGAGATNGAAAVRCAWLTNNATLTGFTITQGATQTSGAVFASQSGGGVWCASSNATVMDCIIVSNTAVFDGVGAFQGTLNNCLVINNPSGSFSGGAVYSANLNNCTVVSNRVNGAISCRATNSIIYYNNTAGTSSLSYCCTTPAATGVGNFTNAPQLLPDGIHLSSTSPCIGAGTTPVTGTDIFGNPWGNPPSVGCAEGNIKPVIVGQPQVQVTGAPVGFTIGNAAISGAGPLTFSWMKDGAMLQDNGHFSFTQSNNLVAIGATLDDAGAYQLIVSNSLGATTSAVAQVIVHCVDAAGANPAPPYTNWMTAATNIQDAITAAAAEDIILVTNGIYATGGKSMDANITNRVSLDKAVLVQSVNGYAVTAIEGQWDPVSTNGPGAVRCAWLTNGAVLSGFTLRNGATRGGNVIFLDLQYGGGAWLSTNAVVSNCALTNNSADYGGGGVAFGTINNSFLTQNTAQYGGGAYQAALNNCTVIENNCLPSGGGGGVYFCNARNCIILYNNFIGFGGNGSQVNYVGPSIQYCCANPLPTGAGNIDTNVTFVDSTFHLPAVSAIRGAGSSLYATGTDMDDQPWANPPSMGCSELVLSNLVGPITVAIHQPAFDALTNHLYGMQGTATGRISSLSWSFGDGTILTNTEPGVLHVWTNAGDYAVTFTAYNQDNPSGVSTNMVVVVDDLNPPALASAGIVSNSFQFSFLAQTSAMYTVQYATNLTPPITWQTLQTIFFSGGGETTIADPSVTNAVRFYRVQVQ